MKIISIKPLHLEIKISHIVFYMLFAAIITRALLQYREHELQFTVNLLLLAFLILSLTQSLITALIHRYTDLYLALQTVLIVVLLVMPPKFDYFAGLFICLSFQVMGFFTVKKGFIWIAIFSVVLTAALIHAHGLEGSVLYSPTAVAVCTLVGLYGMAVRRAEEARDKSQSLLAELQKTYKELKSYAEQVEMLSTVKERNRLARELHDSVTQKIFSMTLTAEAAQILQEKEPKKVPAMLEHIQELAHDSLAEMRTLIKKLRPGTIGRDGLVPALRQHIAQRQKEDGLIVELCIEGNEDLSVNYSESLFRIIQEALNNIVKHSGADSARIVLKFNEKSVFLVIEDPGRGFRLSTVKKDKSHIGLSSMSERTALIGGRFSIESRPENGTRISVKIPKISEG